MLGSCAKKRSLEVPVRPRAAVVDAGPVTEEQVYSAGGALKPGGGQVDWLEIPRAFEKTHDYERHRMFVAKGVTLQRARDFFAERMLTGKVEEGPTEVFYPGALPTNGGADAVRLNLRLTQRLNGWLELDIERLAADEVPPLPFEEAKRAAAAAAKNAQ